MTAGCSILAPVRMYPLHHDAAPLAPPIDDGLEDYAGVIHIHTEYSHDAHGKIEDAVRIGNAQGLDYLIFTEHNTLQPLRDGWQGLRGRVLVLIGMEISARGGHYLALNVTEEIDRFKLTTQQIIDEVTRQGGLGFIAHPFFKKRPWVDWTVTGFTGIEAYNVAHDTFDENYGRLALWTVAASPISMYLSILDRPYDPLTIWDRLIAQHGRVTGIGSSDAHEFHLMGMTFAPYSVMFQMARTHVLTPAAPLSPEAVYEALRRGRAFFATEMEARAKGFTFVAMEGDHVVGVMGDEVGWREGLTLRTWLPSAAQLTLFRNGQEAASTIAQVWEVPVTEPGVYRLEASRFERPWIWSNPIYVRAATQTHADVTP